METTVKKPQVSEEKKQRAHEAAAFAAHRKEIADLLQTERVLIAKGNRQRFLFIADEYGAEANKYGEKAIKTAIEGIDKFTNTEYKLYMCAQTINMIRNYYGEATPSTGFAILHPFMSMGLRKAYSEYRKAAETLNAKETNPEKLNRRMANLVLVERLEKKLSLGLRR
jgi:hypothetical protein